MAFKFKVKKKFNSYKMKVKVSYKVSVRSSMGQTDIKDSRIYKKYKLL